MNEAELIFTSLLNCDRLSLYLNAKELLNKDNAALITSALKRRIAGEPVSYILGSTEFFGLDFKVNKDVLIPRPETEILVEKVLSLVHSSKLKAHRVNILDIGTGSGCIAVSLAKFLPNAMITATDISGGAIAVAKCNAALNGVADRINFLDSDLFKNPKIKPASFDLFVSNPPYIPTQEITRLNPEVRNEPFIALDGGNDGLDFYRNLSCDAHRYLKKDGILAVEIGFGQCEKTKNIFKNSGIFEIIEVVKDYSGIERIVAARRK